MNSAVQECLGSSHPSPQMMAGKRWFSGTLWEAAVNLSGLAATASKAKGPSSPGSFRSSPALSLVSSLWEPWGGRGGYTGERSPASLVQCGAELRRKRNDVVSTRDHLVQGRSQLTIGYSPVCAVPCAGPTHIVSVNPVTTSGRSWHSSFTLLPPPFYK